MPEKESDMDQNLRDQAIAKLREASELLKQSGTHEDLARLAWQEYDAAKGEELFEEIPCSICGTDHHMNLSLVRPKDMSFQYSLEVSIVTYYHDWSFWTRVKHLWYYFKAIFIHKKEEDQFCIPHGDAERRLKDFVAKL
jgi:hypothetical protein